VASTEASSEAGTDRLEVEEEAASIEMARTMMVSKSSRKTMLKTESEVAEVEVEEREEEGAIEVENTEAELRSAPEDPEQRPPPNQVPSLVPRPFPRLQLCEEVVLMAKTPRCMRLE